MTDVGAPTLILNQTSLDGNVEYPPVPHEAVLSYPKKNRHVTFRGDLSHGVASTMSVDSDDDSRLTLLVNWWLDKPMAPNCDYISDKKAKNINFYYPEEVWKMKNDIIVDGKSVSRDAGLDDIAEYSYLDINHEDDRHKHYERHLETLPPADGLHYDMPKIGTMKSGVLYAINWAWNHVFDEVGMLDLWNQNQVNSMFRMVSERSEPVTTFVQTKIRATTNPFAPSSLGAGGAKVLGFFGGEGLGGNWILAAAASKTLQRESKGVHSDAQDEQGRLEGIWDTEERFACGCHARYGY